MSISKKLFIGFGLILGIVSLLFLGDFFAVVHEHNTKDTFFKSIEMRKAMSNLFQERMNNRLRLRNFLLNGDVKEAEALKTGENRIDSLVNIAQEKSVDLGTFSQRTKDLLEDIRRSDIAWQKEFADPLVDKRRQVDEEWDICIVEDRNQIVDAVVRPVFLQHLFLCDQDHLTAKTLTLAHEVAALKITGEADNI